MAITVTTGGPIETIIDSSFTLGALKAEIADDLDRTDLTAAIATEIQRAIKFYQHKRFYFNETRQVLTTVASQSTYTSADNEAIPQFIEFDALFVGDEQSRLEQIGPNEWEMLVASGGGSKPSMWSYYDQSIGLYPIPDSAYAVTITGHIFINGPTTDGEANNPWMTEAYDLIRARTCANLALKKLRDDALFQRHSAIEASEFGRLASETGTKVGTGFMTPTEF